MHGFYLEDQSTGVTRLIKKASTDNSRVRITLLTKSDDPGSKVQPLLKVPTHRLGETSWHVSDAARKKLNRF